MRLKPTQHADIVNTDRGGVGEQMTEETDLELSRHPAHSSSVLAPAPRREADQLGEICLVLVMVYQVEPEQSLSRLGGVDEIPESQLLNDVL